MGCILAGQRAGRAGCAPESVVDGDLSPQHPPGTARGAVRITLRVAGSTVARRQPVPDCLSSCSACSACSGSELMRAACLGLFALVIASLAPAVPAVAQPPTSATQSDYLRPIVIGL